MELPTHESTFSPTVGDFVDDGVFILVELINKLNIKTLFSCDNLNYSNKFQIVIDYGDVNKFEYLVIKDIPVSEYRLDHGISYEFDYVDYIRVIKNLFQAVKKRGEYDTMAKQIDKELKESEEIFKKSFPQNPEKLPTSRLLKVLHKARAYRSSIANYRGDRCCEICHEYIGDDWENDVGKFLTIYDNYIIKLKNILNDRPHIERNKK